MVVRVQSRHGGASSASPGRTGKPGVAELRPPSKQARCPLAPQARHGESVRWRTRCLCYEESTAAEETPRMAEAALVIYIGGQREEREILPVHVVLQVEHARKTGAGDLRFVPGTIGLLGRQEITQPALHARSIEIATSANPHDCPCRL